MTHIARFLLFSTLIFSPVGSTIAAAADEPLGVLVVAHGSTAEWNANVEAAVTIIRQHTPSIAAYLMGKENRTPQAAYDELVAAGVQRIVIVAAAGVFLQFALRAGPLSWPPSRRLPGLGMDATHAAARTC